MLINELKVIIEKFMFNLLGLSKRNIDNCASQKDLDLLSQQENTIFYNECGLYFHKPFDKNGLKISVNNAYNINYQTEQQVFYSLIKKAEILLKEDNINETERFLIYKNTLETELIAALLEKEKAKINKVVDLLQKLKLWSSKSYEGKKMPFAFIIDPLDNSEAKLDYLRFLDSDFSATITDGVTSIITLDLNCNYLSYNSIISENNIEKTQIPSNKAIPLRFAQVLCNNIKGKKLGILLLTSGDILLARDKEILYVLRNGQWINFSSQRYNMMIDSIASKRVLKQNDDDKNQVFSTILDVSFAHSGGIIAIVKKKEFINSNIISVMDNFLYLFNHNNSYEDYKQSLYKKFKDEYKSKIVKKGEKYNELTDEQDKKIKNEFEKRFSKRIAIETLINRNQLEKVKFVDINRRLRSELVGMDGATILDEEGYVISFGAITENEKGSSGGGRGAAASRLSNYQGYATKISTDGYIELYYDGEILYQIK